MVVGQEDAKMESGSLVSVEEKRSKGSRSHMALNCQ